ncbi:hypothetical protein ES705_19244 [subsurface metagenome]
MVTFVGFIIIIFAILYALSVIIYHGGDLKRQLIALLCNAAGRKSQHRKLQKRNDE